MTRNLFLPLVSAVLLWIGFSTSALAAEPELEDSRISDGANGDGPLRAEDIAQWVEERIARPLDERNASAAMAVIVEDGDVRLAQQYGARDAIKGEPIGPDDQFIIASVTKTFTGLAILKLIEEGKIAALDDPANRYLERWKIPAPYGDEVTIGQLAAHNAGFEGPGFGSATGTQKNVPASPQFLNRMMPTVVRRPGRDVSYANYGIVALGILIEDVSGMTYADYVRTRLLEPLGMDNTIVNYDPTGGPALLHPVIWDEDGERYPPRVINDPYNGPAGSIQTTANDMATYLQALLGHRPDVLSPELLAAQRAPLATNDVRLEEAGPGVFATNFNGTKVYAHGGLFVGFRTSLAWAPDKDVGVFIAYAGGTDAFGSTDSNPGIATDVFMELVTGKRQPLKPLAKPLTDVQSLVGDYQGALRAITTREAIYGMTRATKVRVGDDGRLTINGDPYDEVAPGLFQGPPRGERPPWLISFQEGRMNFTKFVDYKVEGLANPNVFMPTALALLALAATGLAGLVGRGPSRWASTGIGLAAIVVAAVLVWPLYTDFNPTFELFAGSTWRWDIGSVAAWIWLIAGFFGLGLSVVDRRRGSIGSLALVHRLLVSVAALGLAWFAAGLNFLW
ncbi:MAG: serine hydrolase domain-containing protein [Erythrobacter sp.]|uniref:serine hydrolase domain-containing protein n=1 Tax=Erythrobacter sp. TaxID=1042 RepID=UPI00260E4FBD|nr:serine hydrolase domain-containing protein [Erythrobacter sp.]MDJ0978174.1 serine hydrolase domain-containing protein [Erythrobacter sp.]